MPAALTYRPKSLGVMFGIGSDELTRIGLKASQDPGALTNRELDILYTFEGEDFAMRTSATRDIQRRQKAADPREPAPARSASLQAVELLQREMLSVTCPDDEFRRVVAQACRTPMEMMQAYTIRDINRRNAERNRRLGTLEHVTGVDKMLRDPSHRTAALDPREFRTAPLAGDLDLTDVQQKAINPHEPFMRNLGEWQSGVGYEAGDGVRRNGYWFRCIAVNDGPTTTDPSEDPLHWRPEM